MFDFSKVLIGQKVWDIDRIKGIVVQIDYESIHPITVDFGDGEKYTYTDKGQEFIGEGQTLFLSKDDVPRKRKKKPKNKLWTTDTPTKDGFYWCRKVGTTEFWVIHFVRGECYYSSSKEWQGPIKEPK